MITSIAATIVLYNPDDLVIKNIQSYSDEVDIIFAIDNSETIHHDIVHSIMKNPKIHYINNNGNQGIAHALNVGATKALEMGYEWLLTMDQDSMFEKNSMNAYVKCWNNYSDKHHVAVFSPIHRLNEYSTNTPCEAVSKFHVMTSGNLLNLMIFKTLKGFCAHLFIDEVDHEYCLRARLTGYSTIEFINISLKHQLGTPVSIGRYGQTTYHSPKRFYYIARNRLYMWKTYHNLFPELPEIQLINIMKTLIFPLIYHDQKLLRFAYIARGIFHFVVGRYGK